MNHPMVRWELVDWTPARHPPTLLAAQANRRRRKMLAFKCNMVLRRVGTRYIHKGGKP